MTSSIEAVDVQELLVQVVTLSNGKSGGNEEGVRVEFGIGVLMWEEAAASLQNLGWKRQDM